VYAIRSDVAAPLKKSDPEPTAALVFGRRGQGGSRGAHWPQHRPGHCARRIL